MMEFIQHTDNYLPLKYQSIFHLIESGKSLSQININRETQKVRKFLNTQSKQARKLDKMAIGSTIEVVTMNNSEGDEVGFYIFSTIRDFTILRGLAIYENFRGKGFSNYLIDHYKTKSEHQLIEVLPSYVDWAKKFYKPHGYNKAVQGLFGTNYMLVTDISVISRFEDLLKSMSN
ncbi:GNAT family N-acetyltransferase [Vibrio parahaemolyticus]|nr:GNAT family N-acetyltransferase [Vibrio parahaemolyticus]EJG1681299.1 GNAT family N-acetyltransferase [Vibrio parahaemolyticus]MDG2754407.1 GNAT family N-acetyltransferase [Vibrio parahaemolyticus]